MSTITLECFETNLSQNKTKNFSTASIGTLYQKYLFMLDIKNYLWCKTDIDHLKAELF